MLVPFCRTALFLIWYYWFFKYRFTLNLESSSFELTLNFLNCIKSALSAVPTEMHLWRKKTRICESFNEKFYMNCQVISSDIVLKYLPCLTHKGTPWLSPFVQLPSLHGGSLEITRTVPLRKLKFLWFLGTLSVFFFFLG